MDAPTESFVNVSNTDHGQLGDGPEVQRQLWTSTNEPSSEERK